MTAWFLLLRRAFIGIATAHAAGLLLLALAVLVEARLPVADALSERVPALWAQVAGTLSLLGAALAAAGMRRDRSLLGLATLGVSPRRLVVASAVVALPLGIVASVLPALPSAARAPGWTRGSGGWAHVDGRIVADVEGSAVGPPPPPGGVPARAWSGAAAGAMGAAAGLGWGALPVLMLGASWTVGEALVPGWADCSAEP